MQGEVSPRPSRAKALFRITGVALTLGALAFIASRVGQHWSDMRDALSSIALSNLLAAVLLYVAASLMLAATWPWLLRAVGYPHLPLLPLAARHLQAQLAKYLPGGIFHFAQRHAGSRQWMIGHGDLVFAASLESLLLLSVAASLALGVSSDPQIAAFSPWLSRLVWLMPLAIPGAWLAARWWLARGKENPILLKSSLPLIYVAFIDIGFFLICSISLFILVKNSNAAPIYWVSWVSLAWISGYIVPGAPGGIGVREAVLVLGLSPMLGDAPALALALAYRLVTLTSDAICTLIGYALERVIRLSE